jgi:hypothetical protein
MNITDLNEELFHQVILLGKAEGDELKDQIAKSNAMANVARTIIENNRTYIEAINVMSEHGVIPEMPAFYQDNRALTHEQ